MHISKCLRVQWQHFNANHDHQTWQVSWLRAITGSLWNSLAKLFSVRCRIRVTLIVFSRRLSLLKGIKRAKPCQLWLLPPSNRDQYQLLLFQFVWHKTELVDTALTSNQSSWATKRSNGRTWLIVNAEGTCEIATKNWMQLWLLTQQLQILTQQQHCTSYVPVDCIQI